MKKDMSSRTQKVFVNSASVVASRLVATLIRFITRTVFIYTLGQTYLGISGLFANILSMLSLSELGFGTAIVYELYKPLAEHNDKRLRILMKFYKQIYRIVAVVILLLGVCLFPFLPIIIKDYETLAEIGLNANVIYGIFLSESVLSYLFYAHYEYFLSAAQKEYVLNVVGILVSFFQNAVQIVVLLVYRNFVLYLTVSASFTVIRGLAVVLITKRYYPQLFIDEPERISKTEVVKLVKDCGAIFTNSLYNRVLYATDNIVISSVVGLNAVALYSNYLLFFTIIGSFIDSMQTVIQHSMGNLFSGESVEKKYELFEAINFFNIIFYGTAAVGLSICSDELMTVWIGRDYVIGHAFSILVGFEMLMKGTTYSMNQVRATTGVFQQMWYRPLISAGFNIGVSIWLVNLIGIHGALIGTIATYLFIDFAIDPFIVHKYSFFYYCRASRYLFKMIKYIKIFLIFS